VVEIWRKTRKVWRYERHNQKGPFVCH